ncbi:MAG TPA: chemotaxis protein CheA [Bacteroidales bacterium]|nr:chemotaxis protein CheA [Bacteroidales bacterium]
MDNFSEKFIEEALDLTNDLESVLLRFEKDSDNSELIERIFRIMHTLKGNSAMFGFTLIDQYTHQLETIYDLIRNNKMKVTPDLMDLTLASVDHIRNLLDSETSARDDVQETHRKLLERIGTIVNSTQQVKEEKTVTPDRKAEVRTFYISFKPSEDILADGTNPLYLVEDFSALGEYIALPDSSALPAFDKLDPEKCYTSWELILATKEDDQKIREIFIFAEDNCTLEIKELSDTNLLEHKGFRGKVMEAASKGHLGLSRVKDLITHEEKEEGEHNHAREGQDTAGKVKNISSIRVSSEKLDELINLVSELVTTQAGLSLIAEKSNNKELQVVAEDVEKLSRRLRDNTFGIRLIPIENMITRFQRLVRELSHELGKDVAFVVEGSEIELDKTIIEGLIDPIMHIIRNSIDHGIENAEVRVKRGKPRQGKILLKAYHSGSNVIIKIIDDGKGIDKEEIRKLAITKGLIRPEANLSSKDLLDLIFLPGFSTSEKITKISGRGVGMDVVKRKISDLRGEVSIDTTVNEKTEITIKLPLTLSIIDGLLVKIDEAFYVIPLSSVNRCFEFKHEALVNAVNNLIYINDGHIPFAYLRKEFGIKTQPPALEQVIVIEYADTLFGLTVDHVVGEYQAVLKSLGTMYKEQDFISGATILGDGTVALLMDPNKIISSYTFKYENAAS